MKEIWKDRPEEQDFPAAHEFLTLHVEEVAARKLVNGLKKRQPSRGK